MYVSVCVHVFVYHVFVTILLRNPAVTFHLNIINHCLNDFGCTTKPGKLLWAVFVSVYVCVCACARVYGTESTLSSSLLLFHKAGHG